MRCLLKTFFPGFRLFMPNIKILSLLFLLQIIERKGLDMVRRDWSLLSKELGDFCLSQILSGGYACHINLFYNTLLSSLR